MAIAGTFFRSGPRGARVFIAADPNYHLRRELYFPTGDQYDIETDFFPRIVTRLGTSPLVVLNPTPDERNGLTQRFPKGKFVNEVDGNHLDHHLIFVPGGSPA